MLFNGMRVIESLYLTEPGEPQVVRRHWRERWCSWPWHPWRATRIVIPQIPKRDALVAGNTIYLHPERVRQIKQMLAGEAGDPHDG